MENLTAGFYPSLNLGNSYLYNSIQESAISAWDLKFFFTAFEKITLFWSKLAIFILYTLFVLSWCPTKLTGVYRTVPTLTPFSYKLTLLIWTKMAWGPDNISWGPNIISWNQLLNPGSQYYILGPNIISWDPILYPGTNC